MRVKNVCEKLDWCDIIKEEFLGLNDQGESGREVPERGWN